MEGGSGGGRGVVDDHNAKRKSFNHKIYTIIYNIYVRFVEDILRKWFVVVLIWC